MRTTVPVINEGKHVRYTTETEHAKENSVSCLIVANASAENNVVIILLLNTYFLT
jgi:hypothetical protein